MVIYKYRRGIIAAVDSSSVRSTTAGFRQFCGRPLPIFNKSSEASCDQPPICVASESVQFYYFPNRFLFQAFVRAQRPGSSGVPVLFFFEKRSGSELNVSSLIFFEKTNKVFPKQIDPYWFRTHHLKHAIQPRSQLCYPSIRRFIDFLT